MRVGGWKVKDSQRPDASVLHAALSSLMDGLAPSAEEKELAARPNPPNPQHRPGCNWRARRVVREINALSSLHALAAFETELRSLLLSQESRRRAKLATQFLFAECNLEETAALIAEESTARTEIARHSTMTLSSLMNTVTMLVDEEQTRMDLVLEYRETVRRRVRLFKGVVLVAEEQTRRRNVAECETFARGELFRRRLIEVGRDLQMELTRWNASSLFVASRCFSSDFLKKQHLLMRAEERDRKALDKLCFLHLSVLYAEAHEHLFSALRKDVCSASALRQSTDRMVAEKALWPAERQNIVSQENRLRAMIEQGESDEQKTLHYYFTIGWRDVYAHIAANPDEAQLMSSMELFERRFVHDQERLERAELTKLIDAERDKAVRQQRRLSKILEEFSRGAASLWQEEHEEYSALHKWHHNAQCVSRAISATAILITEEERRRAQIRGEEVRGALGVRYQMQRSRCSVDAVEGARSLVQLEGSYRDELASYHQWRTLTFPFAQLVALEHQSRAQIEADEDAASTLLQGTSEGLFSTDDFPTQLALLVKAEAGRRTLLATQEQDRGFNMAVTFLSTSECTDRAGIRRGELADRQHLRLLQMNLKELTARSRIVASARVGLTSLAVTRAMEKESLFRARLQRMETERREFLCASTDYQCPLLRACERDELAHRLDIIADAELTIRACAYGQRHDAHISYCPGELQAAKRHLCFFSLDEAFTLAVQDLSRLAEPAARGAIEREWLDGFSTGKLVFEEARGRCRTQETSMKRLQMIHRHGREGAQLLRGFSRAQAAEEDDLIDDPYKGVTWSEDRILRYLRKVEQGIDITPANKTRAAGPAPTTLAQTRKNVHNDMVRLLVDMYLSRDAVVFYETVGRRRLAGLLLPVDHGDTREPSAQASPTLEVHSALTLGSVRRDSSISSSSVEPAAVTEAAMAELTFGQGSSHCIAVANERTVTLVGGDVANSSTSTNVTYLATSAVDRSWTVDHRFLLSTPLSVRLLSANGHLMAEGSYSFSPTDVLDGCSLVDLHSADGLKVRVKLLLHV